MSWWIKFETKNPISIHYFGPFSYRIEAEAAKYGFMLNLVQDGVCILSMCAVLCQPRQRVIYEDDLNIYDLKEASYWLFKNLLDKFESGV